jgi:hypothetical protein
LVNNETMHEREPPANHPITGGRTMTHPNSPQPHRRSWPFAVTAAITLTLQSGWTAEQVITLTTCLLVLIALITSTGANGE